MRLKLILFGLGAVMMWFGAQNAYVGLTNTSPTKLTCSEFTNGAPTRTWIELSNCWIDYDHAFSIESGTFKKSDVGTFLPVRPADNHSAPARLLIKMPSEDVPQRIITSIKTEKIVKGKAVDNSECETISGMLKYGLEGERSKITRLIDQEVRSGHLAADYQVLEEGAKPTWFDVFFGLALLVAPPAIFVFWFRRFMQPSPPV